MDKVVLYINVLSSSFPYSPLKTSLYKEVTRAYSKKAWNCKLYLLTMFLELGGNAYTNISLIPKVELNPRFNNILLDYSLGIDPGFNNILSLLGNNALLEFTLGANLGFNNILVQYRLLGMDCGFDLLLSFTRVSDTPTYAS